jgi:hypothetical protein
VERNARHEISESLGRRHSKVFVDNRYVGVVEAGHEECEFKSTRSNDLAEHFQAWRYVAAFPACNDGLCFVKTEAKFSLRQSGSESSFFYEVAANHVFMIVHICYILFKPLRIWR